MPNLEVKIGEDGEVLVRGPSITKGYYNDPIETEKSFDEGWFKTGDVGEFDEDGYLKIIDRKKRIIVLSTGMNVAPQQVENAVNESPFINQSLVVGNNRKYVICLVNPNHEYLLHWVKENKMNMKSREKICEHPLVKALIEREVRSYTKRLTKYAQPKKVIIISDDWTIDSGEITPKQSLKTNVIEEKYKNIIERAYAEESISIKAII